MRRMSSVRLALVGLIGMTLLLQGCGGAAESGEDVAASEPASSTDESEVPAGDVTVVLSEWIVEPTPTSAPAGELTMVADNQGGEEHEMVVVRADDAADLPTDDDGAVDEAQIPEGDFIGEIEEFPNGEQRASTFDLATGTYVLFCNITETQDDGEVESHFAEGMHTTFTVE
jgi:hypothetical protein